MAESSCSFNLDNLEFTKPRVQRHDLLVEVKGVSVNSVDTKFRQGKMDKPGKPKMQ